MQETMPALPSPQMLDSKQMPAAQQGQSTTGAMPGQDASATNHTVLQQDGQLQQPDQTPQAHAVQNEAQQANQDVQGQVVQEAQPVQQGTNGEMLGGHAPIQEAMGDSQKLPEDAVAPLQAESHGDLL